MTGLFYNAGYINGDIIDSLSKMSPLVALSYDAGYNNLRLNSCGVRIHQL